ncbi:hypothetical protein ACFX2A_017002 [Malus domestica]
MVTRLRFRVRGIRVGSKRSFELSPAKSSITGVLILKQKVERMGKKSGKTSVMWGMLNRFSKSLWNLDFQSGSLKSICYQLWLLLWVKMRLNVITLVRLREGEA